MSARKVVAELSRVLFEMGADDANRACAASSCHNVDLAVMAKRQVVLRNLVALGQIWVVVVLAIPLGVARDRTTERNADHHRHLNRGLVHHRQRAGQRAHHWIDQCVGRLVVMRRMRRVGHAGEHLGSGRELNVDLEADHQGRARDHGGLRIDGGRHIFVG